MSSPGKLYLVPAPLDFGCEVQTPLDQVLPAGTLAVAARLPHWICENAKSARAYLKRVQELCSVPIDLISTGPDREETIVMRHPFDA